MCGCCGLQCVKALLPFSFPMANTRTNLTACSDCHQVIHLQHCHACFLKAVSSFSVVTLSSSKPQLPCPSENAPLCLILLSMFHVSASGLLFFIVQTWLILSILIQPEYTNLPLHSRAISFSLMQNSDVFLQYYLVII